LPAKCFSTVRNNYGKIRLSAMIITAVVPIIETAVVMSPRVIDLRWSGICFRVKKCEKMPLRNHKKCLETFCAKQRLEFEPDEVDPGSGVLKNVSFFGWAIAAKLEKFSDGWGFTNSMAV